MLHPGPPPAFTDGLIEWVAAGRAERLDITAPEPRYAILVQQCLTDRQQGDILQLLGRPLGLRIKCADRFERIAEHIQPHWLLSIGRIDVDYPAANGKFAPL